MAILVSFGAGPIPSVGVITMTVVLNSVGLPLKDIFIIAAVDWIVYATKRICFNIFWF